MMSLWPPLRRTRAALRHSSMERQSSLAPLPRPAPVRPLCHLTPGSPCPDPCIFSLPVAGTGGSSKKKKYVPSFLPPALAGTKKPEREEKVRGSGPPSPTASADMEARKGRHKGVAGRGAVPALLCIPSVLSLLLVPALMSLLRDPVSLCFLQAGQVQAQGH